MRAVDHAERRIAEDESATTEFVIMKDVEAATGSMVTVNPQVFIEKESRHSKLFLTAMVSALCPKQAVRKLTPSHVWYSSLR